MKKIFLFFVLAFSIFIPISSFAVQENGVSSLSTKGETSDVERLEKLENFGRGSGSVFFISTSQGGTKGLYNTLMIVARDMKNLFYIIASIYFLIIVIKLIYAENTEDELGNFKKGIIWITIGLIIMQLAYSISFALFDQGVSARVGIDFFEAIITPLLDLLRLLASFFFLGMAFFAFYRLITANGDEEAIKNGKMTIVYAIIGFILITIAQRVVEAFYGRVSCDPIGDGLISDPTYADSCINALQISAGSTIIIQILNWINGFIAIVIILMLFYSGFQLFFAAEDEKKVKKAKSIILYVALGIGVLVVNYLILTFFLIPETSI